MANLPPGENKKQLCKRNKENKRKWTWPTFAVPGFSGEEDVSASPVPIGLSAGIRLRGHGSGHLSSLVGSLIADKEVSAFG